MNGLKYIFAGVVFGIVMVKSEAVSWFRIQEMFLFESFHMYGIIGSAVAVAGVSVWLIKRFKWKDASGMIMKPIERPLMLPANIIGGLIFGLGWALTGACPGPMFVNLGAGYSVMIPIIASATLGAFAYGILKKKLPH